LRASAYKKEKVKHLIDFHGSPLALRAWRQILDTAPMLLSLLLREKDVPINLLRTKCLREIASNRESRDPKIS